MRRVGGEAASLHVDGFDVAIDVGERSVLLRPSGELDVATAPRLWAALAPVLRSGGPAVLVDLSRLTFSDCAGLRPLRRALRQASLVGTHVEVRGARHAVRRVVDLTGLDTSVARAPRP